MNDAVNGQGAGESQPPKMTEAEAMAYIAKIRARRPSIEQIVASGGAAIPVEFVWNTGKQKIEKKPLLKFRKKPPPKSADEIRRAFNLHWVRDNWTVVGRPTGKASDYDVLDIDPRHGGDKWFIENRDNLPLTETSVTGSGGAHLKFRHVDGVRNSTGDDDSGIAPGIDGRGEGGYHIDWGLSGFPVLNTGIIADWPDWLLEQVLRGGRKKAKSKTKSKAKLKTRSAELPPIAAAMAAGINDKEPPPYTEDNVNLIWSLLLTIPGRISRDEWLNTGRALHWLGPVWHDRALAMWHGWSHQFPEYDEDGLNTQWESFHSEDVDNPVTLGTLHHLARKYNPPVNPLVQGQPAGTPGEAGVPALQQTAILLRDDYRADLGNARKLVKLCGPNVRYLSDAKLWMWWDEPNGKWVLDYNGMMMRTAKYTVELMAQEASKIDDEDERKQQMGHAYRSMQKARLDAMVSLASSEARVLFLAKQLDADPWLAGARGGKVIDLKKGEVRTATREDYITKQLGVAHDPVATCPKWLEYLNLIFDGDQELIRYIQRAVGYTLTGSVAEEIMFLLWESGCNGKTAFCNAHYALMGDYAVTCDVDVLMERNAPGRATPELMQLRGARLASINETQENQKISERQVKYTTSNEPITARNLHEGLVTFLPTHKPWLRTNHLPRITGTDKGIWRRIGGIRFPVDLEKKLGKENLDPYFCENHLLPELPGILNWALEGLRMYLREKLNPPASVQRNNAAYQHSQDYVARWLADCCDIHKNGSGWTYTRDAYDSFALWYRAEVDDKHLISKNRFGRIVREKFGGDEDARASDGQRVYLGFALNEKASAELARHRELETERQRRYASTEATPLLGGKRPQTAGHYRRVGPRCNLCGLSDLSTLGGRCGRCGRDDRVPGAPQTAPQGGKLQ